MMKGSSSGFVYTTGKKHRTLLSLYIQLYMNNTHHAVGDFEWILSAPAIGYN